MQRFVSCIAVATCMLFAGAAQGQVVIDWVTVGDPGNVGELSGAGADPPGFGNDRICGAVDYVYRIGKYEVTNGQYREFLNAAAALGDPNNLYHPSMSTHGGIVRSGDGTPGTPYTYAARDGDATWDSHPVNFISWYDALRFANWLHNGQPVGEQDTDTTEDGAYEMSLGSSVVRKLGARAFLPTEDEWYKAAYYKGGASAGYWNYATQSDTAPTAQAPPGTDMVNGSANYAGLSLPYTTSAVGAYSAKPSDSAYGRAATSTSGTRRRTACIAACAAARITSARRICPRMSATSMRPARTSSTRASV